MEERRLGPGEVLNTSGEVTVPRPAATVILLRSASDGFEVLMVQRNPASRFMGGAWVFPGGAVGRDDGEGDAGYRAAAVRELAEEAGIAIDSPDRLTMFSHWITPPESKIRFDTRFYLAPAPDGAEPEIDGSEVVDVRWYAPQAALDAAAAGDLFLVFPTIKHLEQLARFSSAEELLEYADGREIKPVVPRVISGALGGEHARIVLPGEPGFDD